MPKIMLMLLFADYAQNYAGIMCVSLPGAWQQPQARVAEAILSKCEAGDKSHHSTN